VAARSGARPAGRHPLWSDPRALVAIALLALLGLAVVLGPFLYAVDPSALDLGSAGLGPSRQHPLGTDESGRDVLSRLLHGGRVSLAVGLAAMAVAVGLGSLVGTVAGTWRGRVDTVLMRLADATLAVPAVFVAILALTFFGPTRGTLIAAIGLTSWMGVSRVVRAEVLLLRELPFIDAARGLGATTPRIVVRHLAPHLTPIVLVAAALGVGSALLTESALSFLGLGIQPPAASWGNMLSNAQTYLFSYPWLALYPGLMIVLTVLAVNLLGDALRDATISGSGGPR
jgi:peptide/nickel transport system permease protein